MNESQNNLAHEAFMRQAIELARRAEIAGNHPFGALFVLDDQVVATAENGVVTDNDITAHAELNLVRTVHRALTAEQLAAGTLYTSTEPCAMCSGAIYWAGIRQIVYACSGQELADIARSSFVVSTQELLDRAEEQSLVVGGVLAADAIAQHRAFWPVFLGMSK